MLFLLLGTKLAHKLESGFFIMKISPNYKAVQKQHIDKKLKIGPLEINTKFFFKAFKKNDHPLIFE